MATGLQNPTQRQIHKLSKLLLDNGADHEDVGRVRNMLGDWKATGRGTVSMWIEALDNPDPIVSGEAAMDVCRRADKHHFSKIARAKRLAHGNEAA